MGDDRLHAERQIMGVIFWGLFLTPLFYTLFIADAMGEF
jgi:TM2 domain-containing membrane protein YozV